MIKNGEKYLITSNEWFFAPDGESYRAVWGKCTIKTTKEMFGFDPSRPSTNWFMIIGDEGHEVVIAGCQIHYAVRCEEIPNNPFKGTTFVEKETGIVRSADKIYITE